MEAIRRVGLGLMSLGVFGMMGVGTALGLDRYLESLAVGETEIIEETRPAPAALATTGTDTDTDTGTATATATDTDTATATATATDTAMATATATDTATDTATRAVTLPDLNRLRVSEARARLEALGLRMRASSGGYPLVRSDHRFYRVVGARMDPPAGTAVEPGSVVRIRSRPIASLLDGY